MKLIYAMKGALFLIFIFIVSFTSYSQSFDHSISGILLEQDSIPLIGGNVIIMNNKDSIIRAVISDINGHFTIAGLKKGPYYLRVSFLGFDTYKVPIGILSSTINLGNIKLTKTNNLLGEIRIIEKIQTVIQKGDTTEFNAKGFSVHQDANIDDLLKKMPGFDVSNTAGTLKAQGEIVVKILLDGKPFMGDDASLILKSLPADIVDKIQVYDLKSEQSQFTGFDDGKTLKTVNIVTKTEKQKGIFGNAYLGFGNATRYQTGLNINKFNGKNRMSIIGQSNNVNNTKSSQSEIPTQANGTGITNTNAGAINYSNIIKGSDFSTSYSFNETENASQKSIFREYVTLNNNGQIYKQNNNGLTTTYSHRFSLKYDYRIDSNNSIAINPTISLSKNNALTHSEINLNTDSSYQSQTKSDATATSLRYSVASDMLFKHRFSLRRRTFTSMLSAGYTSNTSTNTLTSNSTNNASFAINQMSVITSPDNNLAVTTTYTEPLSRHSILQCNILLSAQKSVSEKNTNEYSPVTSEYDVKDTLLSNRFRTESQMQQYGVGYSFKKDKLNVSAGISYQLLKMKNEISSLLNLTRHYQNILPTLVTNYKISSNKSFVLTYRMATIQPQIGQLQNVINNTNPILLTTGNPQLKQSNQHNLTLRYNLSLKEKSQFFFITSSISYTDRYITNVTRIAENDSILNGEVVLRKGGQISMPMNIGNNLSITLATTYSRQISSVKSNLTSSISYTYRSSPTMINDQINYSTAHSPTISLAINSSVSQKVDFSVSSATSYNTTYNNLNSNFKNNYLNQTNSLNLYWMFWRKTICQTGLTQQLYFNASSNNSPKYLLWNIAIAKKVFENSRGEVRVSVFDALGQNRSIQRTFTNQYYEEQRSTILQRYFMVTFSYKLVTFGGK